MAKSPKTNKVSTAVPGSRLERWGGETKNVHLPSGSRIVFKEDENAILKFLGQKDISDKVKDAAPGTVIYNTMFDGKKVVNMPVSYAFTDFEMIPGKYYYVHMAGIVQTREEYNPMKDFEIKELGSEGDEVPCDQDLTGCETIKLCGDIIADLNYTKLNYPLRKA